jgi:hypothetical protein
MYNRKTSKRNRKFPPEIEDGKLRRRRAVFQKSLKRLPWYSTLGNHDHDDHDYVKK